jgi:ABC-type bacteriocin/lantibiotic exporter with double-glycine peptidase domain
MSIRRIKQKDKTGCGIACIAMLADRRYEEIRKIALSDLDFERRGDFYTRARHLRKLGKSVGVVIQDERPRKFKGWDDLPDKAIIAINPKDNCQTWHWVVFVREDGSDFVLDPKPSVKSDHRTDFGRMKPVAFLPVQEGVT